MKFYFLIFIFISGCASQFKNPSLSTYSHNHCVDIHSSYSKPTTDNSDQLDQISDLYDGGCYKEVIELGKDFKNKYREKKYSISTEASEVFFPEGHFTPYVMESYERSYLSLLMALSYSQLGSQENADIETRKSTEEQFSELYNKGEDPINLLLQAIYWENREKSSEKSRPFWKRITESKDSDKELKKFASERIIEIDAQKNPQPWTVYKLNSFPDLDWSIRFNQNNSSYYSLTPKEPFSPACQSANSLQISTELWLKKIAHRYDKNYHPFLNLKSWTRLPVGVIYFGTLLSAGVSVTIIGCVIDAKAGADNKVCELAGEAGSELAKEGALVFKGVIKPDMRHWKNIPNGFLITRNKDNTEDPCVAKSPFTKKTIME